MVELIIVIALILGVSAIVLSGGYFRHARLQGTARDIRQLLWQGRQRAIRIGVPVVIQFSSSDDSATMYQDTNGNGAQDTGEATLGTYTLPKYVHFWKMPSGAKGDANAVAFDSVTPSGGGTAIDDAVIFLASGASIAPSNPVPSVSTAGIYTCATTTKGIYIRDERSSDCFRISVDDVGTSGRVTIVKNITAAGTTYGPQPWNWL